MRWKSGKPKFNGELRTVTVFLLFPRKIEHEWRWLEKASILQRADRIYATHDSFLHWEDIEWVDEKGKIE